MVERDEQHMRNNRFAELCSGIVDAFSSMGSPKNGTLVLLHIRRSTAFFQSKDPHEASAIKAMAEVCMKRRQQAPSDGEQRPLLLCVVAWDTQANVSLAKQSQECRGHVEAEDLNPAETESYVDHLIRLRAQGDKSHIRAEDLSPTVRRDSLQQAAQVVRRLSQEIEAVNLEEMRQSMASKERVRSKELLPPAEPAHVRPVVRKPTPATLDGQQLLGTKKAPLDELAEVRPEECQDSDKEEDDDSCVVEPREFFKILCSYVYEMTGGNLLAIQTVFQDLIAHHLLFPCPGNPSKYRLDQQCTGVDWIKKTL